MRPASGNSAAIISTAIPGGSSATPMTEALAPDVAGSHWQTAKIVEIIPRTPTIKSFIFRRPRPFAFRAGQHVDLRLTAPDGYRAMRSYSIASAPADSNRIELAIDL